MLKRVVLLGAAALFLTASTAIAAPHVNIAPSQIQADLSCQATTNSVTYHGNGWSEDQNVNGHVLEYGISIGLKNKYALSIDVGNYRYNVYDNPINKNQHTTPKLDSINFNVQKQLTDNFAVFVGTKHTSGNWKYHDSVENYTVVSNNYSKDTAVVGLIAEKEVSNKINAYIKTEIGRDFQAYKIGLSHANFNLGYGYTKHKNIENPDFSTWPAPANGLNLITKGVYFGVEHKF